MRPARPTAGGSGHRRPKCGHTLPKRTPETLRSAQGPTACDPAGDVPSGRQGYEMRM